MIAKRLSVLMTKNSQTYLSEIKGRQPLAKDATIGAAALELGLKALLGEQPSEDEPSIEDDFLDEVSS